MPTYTVHVTSKGPDKSKQFRTIQAPSGDQAIQAALRHWGISQQQVDAGEYSTACEKLTDSDGDSVG